MEIGGSSSYFNVKKKEAETDLSSSIVTKKPKILDQFEQHVTAPEFKKPEWVRWEVSGDYDISCKVTCACAMKITDDWIQFKLNMPGLSKEEVTISFEGPTRTTVRIIGEGNELPEADVGYTRQYSAVFAFQIGESEFLFKDYQTEMNNGLFVLRFPKIKDFTYYRWTNPFDKGENSQGEAQFFNYSSTRFVLNNGYIIPPFADPTSENHNKIMEFFTFKSCPSDEMNLFPSFEEENYCSCLDDDKLVMWFDMPGLELNHVQIEADGDTMMIKAEGIESPVDDDQRVRRYANGFSNLPQEEYDFHAWKTAMKNGVLKVEVPKVKK